MTRVTTGSVQGAFWVSLSACVSIHQIQAYFLEIQLFGVLTELEEKIDTVLMKLE